MFLGEVAFRQYKVYNRANNGSASCLFSQTLVIALSPGERLRPVENASRVELQQI